MGVNVEHKISDNFLVGATFLKCLRDRLEIKFWSESVNNTIFGFNTNFSSEVPFLTRLVNKLPNVDTAVKPIRKRRSSVLKPDSPKADQFEGESTIYDDFEGSQTTIDMRSSYWSLSSTRIEIREVDTISMLMQMI
jgi:cell surface protein SprA